MNWLHQLLSDFLASLGADVLWGLTGGRPGSRDKQSPAPTPGAKAGHTAGKAISKIQKGWNRLQTLLVQPDYARVREYLMRATADPRINSAKIKRALAKLDDIGQKATLDRLNTLSYEEFCLEAGGLDMPGPVWETITDFMSGKVYPGGHAAARAATRATITTRRAVRANVTDTWWGRALGGRNAGLLKSGTPRTRRNQTNPTNTGLLARLLRRNP